MSMEFSMVHECLFSECHKPIGTPEYHPGPEESDPKERPMCDFRHCIFAWGLPEYKPQESDQTVNQPQPAATLNTRYGIGKTLTMNKDEVEETPSEEESTDAFKSEGTKAFEVKGTEALRKKVLRPSSVKSTTKQRQNKVKESDLIISYKN